MVASYNIFGRQIQSHWLSMATLFGTFGVAMYATSGKKAAEAKGPPINASSKEEESFIQDFLKEAESKSEAK
ncbi:hypothetical protein NA57DRAFT_75729 [Rhizodiscina lignyota]|uniref:ATP synthase subunit K, mitochondrial n=1 Tax=Rhizodiscina lignyota TaxID=1504668 RepID=A0A9P4MA72_9PEZI|nr:hypothetical protein NA57DRAFT_75729 [Rhizodiscina lignyota]